MVLCWCLSLTSIQASYFNKENTVLTTFSLQCVNPKQSITGARAVIGALQLPPIKSSGFSAIVMLRSLNDLCIYQRSAHLTAQDYVENDR